MEQNNILVATVFEGNIINNRIIVISEDISEKEISELNMLLNTSLTGLTMDQINLSTIMKLRNDAGEYSDVIDQVLTEISEAFTNNEDDELEVYTSGATNIFKYPELTGGDAAGMLEPVFLSLSRQAENQMHTDGYSTPVKGICSLFCARIVMSAINDTKSPVKRGFHAQFHEKERMAFGRKTAEAMLEIVQKISRKAVGPGCDHKAGHTGIGQSLLIKIDQLVGRAVGIAV